MNKYTVGQIRQKGTEARKGESMEKNKTNSTGDTAKDRVNRVDPYGFERPEDFDYESYEELMSEYLVVLTQRSIKWSKLLKSKRKVQRNVKLKRYIRKGVPNEHRALVWMAASGAQEQLEKNPGYYQALLGAQHDPKLVETICTDLNRTFPDNVQFRKTSNPCLQKALYNVLLAYGHHNAAVGYCQGMNFIAGYLLIVTKDEEKSFWLMDALLGRILPGVESLLPTVRVRALSYYYFMKNGFVYMTYVRTCLMADYYSPAMLGLKTDQEVLGELVRVKSPRVWKAMMDHNVMWTLVVSRWFICLFIDILPVETVLRIWDCLFYEGSKILFRVALTLIHHYRDLIEQAQSLPDICQIFKQITRGAFVEECHPFMQKIFTEPGSLSIATLTKLRAACRARVIAEEAE